MMSRGRTGTAPGNAVSRHSLNPEHQLSYTQNTIQHLTVRFRRSKRGRDLNCTVNHPDCCSCAFSRALRLQRKVASALVHTASLRSSHLNSCHPHRLHPSATSTVNYTSNRFHPRYARSHTEIALEKYASAAVVASLF